MLVADALKGGVLLAARATLNLSLADLFSSLSRGKNGVRSQRSACHQQFFFSLTSFAPVLRNRPGAALRLGTRGRCELTVVVACRGTGPNGERTCLHAPSGDVACVFLALLTQPTWLVLGRKMPARVFFFFSSFLQCTSPSGDVYRSGEPFLLGQLLSRAVPTLHNIVT